MGSFAPYFFLTLAAVLASWGLGWGARQLVWPRAEVSYFRLFLELLLGLTSGVVAFALVKTGGVSVLWPIVPVLLGIGWLLRRQAAAGERAEVGHTAEALPGPGGTALMLAGITLGVYGLRFLLLYDSASPFLRTPYEDFVFYARVAANLGAGIETPLLEPLYPQFVTEYPYHYLELWLTTLLAEATGLPSLFTLYLATYSVLLVIMYVGLRAVVEQLGFKRGAVAILLPVLLLLLTGIYWPFFNRIPHLYNTAGAMSVLLPVGPKLLPVFLVLTMMLLLLMRQHYTALALALALLPLVFVTSGPTALAAAAALAFTLWWPARSWAALLRPLAAIVGAVVFIGIFYALQPAATRSNGELEGLRKALPRLSDARTLVNIFIGHCLAIAAYFGPILALAGAAWWRARPRPVALPQWTLVGGAMWLAITLAGLAVWTLGNHYIDAFQFFSNVATPATVLVLAALLAGGLVRLSRAEQWAGLTVLAALLSVNLFTLNTRIDPMHLTKRYAPAFLQAVRGDLQRLAPAGGGFWLADSSYHSGFDMNADAHIAGAYVFNFATPSRMTSLSALRIDSISSDPRFRKDSASALSKMRNSTLYRFQQFEGKSLPLDSLPLRLARRAGLRYVCAGPGERLPAAWHPRIERAYHDPVSDETLYILKPN